jgi:hypothetical protein
MAVSAAAVLLLGGLVFLLFRALAQSSEAATALEAAQVRLKSYYSRNPFPNHTNVVVEKSNATTMRQWRDDLLHTLSTDQIVAPNKTPAQFEIFLSSQNKELRDAAMRNGVKLPPSFSFGFARYADGRALPDSREDLPSRLAEQMVLVDRICRLMFEERILELNEVVREEFAVEKSDGSGPGPASGGSFRSASQGGGSRLSRPAGGVSPAADKPSAGSGYRKLHFAFEIRVREQVLTSLLNRLASDTMFIVVNSVEIDAPADAQLGVQPRREDATNSVGRVARVVCGPEMTDPSHVKIELDVYRF